MGTLPLAAPPLWKHWVSAARPQTLTAAVAPVLAATAIAIHDDIFNPLPLLICLLFAVLIQVGTNFANDYYDAIKGADTPDRIGPTRAVASGLITPAQMRRATYITLSFALCVGFTLTHFTGYKIIPLGLLCLVLAIAYTGGPFPLAYLGLGDIFVFVFFGLVAVMLTYYSQNQSLSWMSFWAGSGCGLFATNILVVNNYRDRDSDAKAKKNTSTVRLGKAFSLKQYTLSALIAPLTAIPLYILGYNASVFILLLLLIPGIYLAVGLSRARGNQYNTLLGNSAKLLLAYPILLLVSTALSLS